MANGWLPPENRYGSPNPRLQRTRLRAPLSRKPLGDLGRKAALTILALVFTSGRIVGESEDDDAAVLRAALADPCRGQQLLIQSGSIEPFGRAHGIPRSAFTSLKNRNHVSRPLPLSDACPGASVVSKPEVDAAFHADQSLEGEDMNSGWRRLFKAFPGSTGLVSLSLPGYSSRGDLAVVYLVVGRGSLAGVGRYVVLKRKQREWTVVARKTVWVA
jgi:hypothetical protein